MEGEKYHWAENMSKPMAPPELNQFKAVLGPAYATAVKVTKSQCFNSTWCTCVFSLN